MTEKIVTPDSEEDKFIVEVREKLHKYLLYEDQYKYGSLDLLEKELDKENPNYKKFLRDKVSESDLWCDIIFILFRKSIYDYDKKEILYKNILKFRMLSRWIEEELCTKENIKKDIKFIINEILQYIDEIINEERRGNNFYKLSEDEKNKKLIIINELINRLMIWVKNIIGYEDYRDNSRLKRKLYLILSKTKNDDYERQPLLIFYIVLQILINLKKKIKRRKIRSAYSVISACIVFSLLHSLYYRSYRKKKDKINIINKYRYYFGNELLKYINNRYEVYIQKFQSNEEFESKLRILKLKYEKYVNDRIVFNGVNKHGNDDPVELRKYYYKMRGLLYGLSIVNCNYIDCMAKRGKVVPADFYIELSKAIRNNELRCCKNCGIRAWWPKWWKETANSKEEKQCLDYMEFQYFFWLDEYSKGKLNRIFNCKIKKIDRNLEEILCDRTGIWGGFYRSSGPAYDKPTIESDEDRRALAESYGNQVSANGLTRLYQRIKFINIEPGTILRDKIKNIKNLKALLSKADSNKYNHYLIETQKKLNSYDSQIIRAFLRGEIDFLFTRTYKKLDTFLSEQKTESENMF